MSSNIIGGTMTTTAGTGGSRAGGGGGAQFLTSRGIDTSSLFSKAQNLDFKFPTTSTAVINTTSSNSTNNRIAGASRGTGVEGTTTGTTTTTSNTIMNTNSSNNFNIHSTIEQIRNQTISKILSQHKSHIHNLVNAKIHNQITQEWETKTKYQLMNDLVVTVDERGTLDRLLVGENTSNDATSRQDVLKANTFMTTTSNLSHIQLQALYSLASYHHTNLYKSSSSSSSFHPQQYIQTIMKISHELSLSDPNYYNPYYSACQLVATLSSSSSSSSKSANQQNQSFLLQGQRQSQPVSSPPYEMTSTNPFSSPATLSTLPSSSSLSNNTKFATIYQRTISSLLFLSNQFRDYVITKVKNSPSSAATTTTTSSLSTDGTATTFGLTTYITKYIENEYGYDYFHSGSSNVLFKCIYYSLRCGDLQTAYDFYNSSNVSGYHGVGGGQYAVLKKVLDHLLHYVNDKCKASTSSSRDDRCMALFEGLNNLPTAYIQEMNDLYHHVLLNTSTNNNDDSGRNTGVSREGNQYEIALLGMLSFSDLASNGSNASSNVANATIEDYIYLTLWNTLAPNGNMVDGIFTLGESIKSYGSDYFEGTPLGNDAKSVSCGWKFVMPLLLSQCYKTAFIHLAQRGNGVGLCLAVHLILALSNSKQILITDVSDELKIGNENGLREVSNDIISTLLIAYARTLQTHSPTLALEYLIHVPDVFNSRIKLKNKSMVLSQKAEKQIINLILETRTYDLFAGQVSSDGSRPASGILDNHFTSDGVSELLSCAANNCIHEGKVSDAAQLLSLAGQFTTLLSLLNRKLASLVVITKEDGLTSERQEQRQLWRDAAHRFHSMYLSQGHSQVIQMLEDEQQISLGMDFQLLLNLMVFFDRCYNEEWKAAWELIADLDLLPTGDDAVNSAVECFNSQSDSIQQIFHHILLKAMECLSNIHSMFKISGANQSLFEIRNKAKCLVSFAGYIRINHANEVRSKLSQMEAYMI